MKSPRRANGLLKTVNSMHHRERFILKASSEVDEKYGTECYLELYYADIKNTTNTNISITAVDSEGNVMFDKEKDKPARINRILSKFDSDFAKKLLPSIDQEPLAKQRSDEMNQLQENATELTEDIEVKKLIKLDNAQSETKRKVGRPKKKTDNLVVEELNEEFII